MLASTHDFYKYSSGKQVETRSILLMGTAQDGPINFPTLVTNIEHARSIFGESRQGNLLSAAEVIFENIKGQAIIYLMRVSGREARREFNLTLDIFKTIDENGNEVDMQTTKTGIGFKSYYGGERYNNIQIIYDKDSMQEPYIFFELDGVQSPRYYLNRYPKVSDLIRAISEDTRKGIGFVLAYSSFSDQSPSILINSLSQCRREGNMTLAGGLDESDICKDELYDCLEESYKLLSGFYMDIVVPVGAYFDDPYPSFYYGRESYFDALYAAKRDYLYIEDEEGEVRRFHKQLTEFCESQMRFGFMPHGVLGFYPVLNPDEYTRHPYSAVLARVSASDFATRKGLGDVVYDKPVDKGFFISVVLGDFYKGEKHIPGYLVYAAMLINLMTEDTTTNQPIPMRDEYVLAYELEAEEIEALANIGIVVFRNSPKRGIVVANGSTCGLPGTPFHWYSNIRQTQVSLAKIYESVLDLEGSNLPSDILQREIEERAKKVLAGLKAESIIIDYTVRVEMIGKIEAKIHLELMPKYAVEFIQVRGAVPILT